MQNVTQSLLARYAAMQQRSSPEVPSDDSQVLRRRSYRQAAAVLHGFVPQELNPLDPNLVDPHPWSLLNDDLIRMPGADAATVFTLKLDVRRQALTELGSVTAMQQALSANPNRQRPPLQVIWEEYLSTGKFPAIKTLGYEQLIQVHQVATWVESILPRVPTAADVLAEVRQKSVLVSFEHLVANHFTGREAELARLREHIGALPAATGWRAVQKQLTAWLGTKPRPILAICGPGGIGKTSLVGRMLWEHSQVAPQVRIPFAYLAFDLPTLRVETPFTLLVDAVAQFSLQYPEHAEVIEEFQHRVREYRDARSAIGHRQISSTRREVRVGTVHGLDEQLYVHFAYLIRELASRKLKDKFVQVPVLFALDTFEEVQYRDRESLAGFWRMLNTISEQYPPFRVVISGRGSIVGMGATSTLQQSSSIEEFQLEELNSTDRVQLLNELGVTDVTLARALASQVGGNPLSLRLAARVVADDASALTKSGLRDLKTRDWYLFKVDDEIIQGQLYRRVLDHIHDPNVRKLAHPGMVLRRVNPDVIRGILAPFCQIPLASPADAERLFDALKQEHTLVQIGNDGALIYRPHVRRAMIRLLQQDKFHEVRELHRAAVWYYERQTGEINRAEEIYHRLVLNEDEPEELNRRWMPGIDQLIVASLEEYPDRAQAWLASQMSLEVPRHILEGASVAEWERNITRKVQRALSELDLNRALDLLRERSERSAASPLFALGAKTYLLMQDYDTAWNVLDYGIRRVIETPNRGRLAELYWLQAQVALLRNGALEGVLEADSCWQRAEEALSQGVRHGGNSLALAHVLCHRLLLRTYHNASYSETAASTRIRLSQACDCLPESIPYSAHFVLQLAQDLLQDEFPSSSQRLRELARDSLDAPYDTPTADMLTSENRVGLDEYREPWEFQQNLSNEAAV